MGYSIPTTLALLFLATMAAVGSIHAVGHNTAERIGDAGEAELADEREQLRTDLRIVEATYYQPDDRLVVDVENAGSIRLAVPDSDVLLDGALRLSFAVDRIEGDPGTEVWAPGETRHIEAEVEDPLRLKVVSEGGIARATSLTPYSQMSVEWPMFGHDSSNTGHINATVTRGDPEQLWSHATDGNVTSPAVLGGTLYVGDGGGTVRALTGDGEEVWSRSLGSAVGVSPAVSDGVVYVGTEAGNVTALDATNGTVLWNATAPDGPVRSPPTVVGEVVYVGEADGTASQVYAIHAANGTTKWTYSTADVLSLDGTLTTGGDVRTAPAVTDGVLYVGTDGGAVHAVHANNGSKKWVKILNLDRRVRSSPAVKNGTVYVGTVPGITTGGSLYALDADDGSERWGLDQRPDVQPESSPSVVNGTVYVVDRNDAVVAIDASNGDERWRNSSIDATESSPAIADGTVVVGSDDGSVYALNATDGSGRWSFPTGDPVTSSPAIVDESVYVGSDDDHVYAIG